MDSITAENIGKKAKALKHCDKLLSKIESTGAAKVKLNCTGVEFVVRKDDAIYLRIQSTKYALLDEIKSYELTTRTQRTTSATVRRTAPAPIGAAEPTANELAEIRKERQREYQRRYYEKKKAQAKK